MIRRLWYWPERIPHIPSREMRCLHFWLFVFWAANIPTAYAFGWLALVVYVSLASIYANAANHLVGWSAERPTQLEADQ